jgi:hypothetical protein
MSGCGERSNVRRGVSRMPMIRGGKISREPPMTAALADPMVRGLMAVDKVDAGELRLQLDEIAGLLTRRGSAAKERNRRGGARRSETCSLCRMQR